MNKLRTSIACVSAAALLAGCGGGGSNGIPAISSVNPLSTGKLQFAVGTANLFGTGTGLNVVSTYRQAGGLSNVTVDTPTITGPFTLPAVSSAGGGVDQYSTLPNGPSALELATNVITGTSQALHPGTPTCDQSTPCTVPNSTGGTVTIAPNTSTFGQSGGVFTNGLAPGNYNNQGVASSYRPYVEPLYSAASGNQFVPFGGPPAFPGDKYGLGLRDGLFNLGQGVVGIPEGITTFAGVGVATGTYTLALSVPTGFSGQTPTFGSVATTASMSTSALLGAITAPTLNLDGAGGGTFTISSLPAGVTEELVQIVDAGNGATNCQGPLGATGGAGPVYYTILVKAAGIYALPDTIGPNTTISNGSSTITPSPSICTVAQNTAAAGAPAPGDTFTTQAIGADYPLYESLYPNSTSQTPTIVGANGQADITISPVSAPVTSSSVAHRLF